VNGTPINCAYCRCRFTRTYIWEITSNSTLAYANNSRNEPPAKSAILRDRDTTAALANPSAITKSTTAQPVAGMLASDSNDASQGEGGLAALVQLLTALLIAAVALLRQWGDQVRQSRAQRAAA